MTQTLTHAELILLRLAKTLGVSPELFHEEGAVAETVQGQSALLLRTFLQISDPEIRQRCLRFVENAAQGPGAAESR